MAFNPRLEFGKSTFQEYLDEGEKFVVPHSNDWIEVVKSTEVKDSRYAKGSNNRVDSGCASFWG